MICIIYKDLVSIIYKEFLRINKKTKKWAKILNKHFIEDHVQIVRSRWKLLDTRTIQMKIMVSCYLTHMKMTKTQEGHYTCEPVEQPELWCVFWQQCKRTHPFGELLGNFLESWTCMCSMTQSVSNSNSR